MLFKGVALKNPIRGKFKGFALKNPIRGFAPDPHKLFEKSLTKTFNCHSWRFDNHSERSEPEKFFVHFFSKKWAGFLRAAALKQGEKLSNKIH